MKAYILKTVDYTLKREGEPIFTIVDENGDYLRFGAWKSKKACLESWKFNFWGIRGYELQEETLTKHQNYSH